MALGWIGTRTVASESENTLEAVQCGLYWDSARRQALRDYPWNFAQRRAWLAVVPMPTGYEKQYRFAYALPVDMLKALQIFPDGVDTKSRGDRESGRFIIVHDSGNACSILLSNASRALLSYTADMEDITLFDDLFIHMLARKLAALIAVPLLKNNTSKLQELEQLYTAAIPSAIEADASEGAALPCMDTWLVARGGGYASKHRI